MPLVPHAVRSPALQQAMNPIWWSLPGGHWHLIALYYKAPKNLGGAEGEETAAKLESPLVAVERIEARTYSSYFSAA